MSCLPRKVRRSLEVVRTSAALAGFGLALMIMGCTGAKTAPPDPVRATPVKVLVEKPVMVEDTSEYVATIKSRFSVTIQPEVEGHITNIFVKSGDRVGARAKLLEIDPLKQSATVNSQEATRKAREANLQWARIQLERSKQLYAAGVVSRQDLDQAQTAYDAAHADLSSVDAQVREQQVQLHYYNVLAPIGGIVGDVPVHVGDRVTQTTMLTTIDANRSLEAYLSVPTERASQIRMGAPVQILDGDGKVLVDTRITFISPQVDTATQSVLIKAAVPQNRPELRSAQFVRARVVWSSRQGLRVPVVAVSRISGQYFVFVAEPDAKGAVARQRAVRLGQITGSDYVVQDGLKPGDQVIVSGAQSLADGSLVTIEK